MTFPLDVRFKLLAIASQIAVRDANGALLYYASQKAFKLKEAVTVFADADSKSRPSAVNRCLTSPWSRC